MAVVADTTFLIDLADGVGGAVSKLRTLERQNRDLLIPSVAVVEYLAGSADPQHDFQILRGTGTILNFTGEDAREAGDLARKATAAGTFPGWNDLLLQGLATRRGDLSIVTRDPGDFDFVNVTQY